MGKGVSRAQFHEFMSQANQLLKMEIATLPSGEKAHMQQQAVRGLIDSVRRWKAAELVPS